MPRRLTCLQAFSEAGVDAMVECKGCRRRVRMDARQLMGRIPNVQWWQWLDAQGQRLKCSGCGHRGARIAPVPRIVGPLDCDEFRADIEAMWERVMAEQQQAQFELQRDDNGDVWICSTPGSAETWCRNLGPFGPAGEVMADFLGQHDWEELGR